MYTIGLCVCSVLMEGLRSGFTLGKSNNPWNLVGVGVSGLTTLLIICIQATILLPVLGRIFGKW